MGLLERVYAILPEGNGPQSAYTDEELLNHARQFHTNKEWLLAGKEEIRNGSPSHWTVAYKRGKEFFQQCVAHMERAPCPVHFKYTDQQIIESALRYKYRIDWKRMAVEHYRASVRKGIDFHNRVTAHMLVKSNPYAGDYIIYAYEFADHHAYAGLTFKPKTRFTQHFQSGPVFRHFRVCTDCELKIVEYGIKTPQEAAEAEKRWILDYMRKGWTMLNHSGGGSLGTVAVKWTREAVIAEARKYATKQEWIDKSQRSYRIAKVEGWFDEAAAHMPLRDARHLVGREFSEETREKMSKAAQRRGADPEWRANHSAALKGRPWSEESRAAHM